MASDGGSTAAAISAAFISSDRRHTVPLPSAITAAIISSDQRHTVPEPRRWKGYWTRYWCFKSQKRDKRIVPAARPHGASDSSRGWLPAQAVLSLVPPSSPASFVNSTIHSPAASTTLCSPGPPGPPNTMFTVGPYAHETQLVSPPVFSTYTTEPSTATVTPPPELAHLTTPSSPDVPFAQYIASSLEAKAARRETISPLSTGTLASPCDTPASHTPTLGHLYLRRGIRETISPRSTSTLASPYDTPGSYTPPTSGHLYSGVAARETISPHSLSNLASPCDTPASYTPKSSHHYLGSPINCLVSPSMGKEDAFPADSYATASITAPPFPTFDPFSSPNFSRTPFATLILPCDPIPEDPSMSFMSETHLSEDMSRTSGPSDVPLSSLLEVHICENSTEAQVDCPGSEEELHQRRLQEMAPGSMPSEDCKRVDVGVHCPTDVELSKFIVKEDERHSAVGERLQEPLSWEFEEKKYCSSPLSRGIEEQGAFAENAQDFQGARASSSLQHAAIERLVQGPAASGSDACKDPG